MPRKRASPRVSLRGVSVVQQFRTLSLYEYSVFLAYGPITLLVYAFNWFCENDIQWWLKACYTMNQIFLYAAVIVVLKEKMLGITIEECAIKLR